jgi:hypothetical protein
VAFSGTAFLVVSLSRTYAQQLRLMVATAGLRLFLEYLPHASYRNAMECVDVWDDLDAILGALVIVRLGSERTANIQASGWQPVPRT